MTIVPRIIAERYNGARTSLGARSLSGGSTALCAGVCAGDRGGDGLWPGGLSPGVPRSMDWLDAQRPRAQPGPGDWLSALFDSARAARPQFGFPMLCLGLGARGPRLAAA